MKKVFILSIMTILLSALLIVGSSYALFTSTSRVNIAVTSGKVDVVATMDNLQYKSLLNDWSSAPGNYATFDNLGGSAQIDQTTGSLVMEKVLPGDAVKLDIIITNNSNVHVKYRVVISEVTGKIGEMVVKIDDELRQTQTISDWFELLPNSSDIIVPVEIELPLSATTQDLNLELSFTVQAVQANGDDYFDTTFVSNFDQLKAAFNKGGEIVLEQDIEVLEELVLASDATLEMNGKKLSLANNTINPMINVLANTSLVIDGNGIFDLGNNYEVSFINPEGNVTIENGTFTRNNGGSNYSPLFKGVDNGSGKLIINDGYFDGGYFVDGDYQKNCANLLDAGKNQYVRVYGGTFVAQNPAWGDEGNACTCNLSSTACDALFFEGQAVLDTSIPLTYQINVGQTNDARPTYTVTYEPVEREINDKEIDVEGVYLTVSNTSPTQKVVFSDVTIKADTIAVANKPIELQLINVNADVNNGFVLGSGVSNTTVVIQDCNFILANGGKIVDFPADSIPTVIYLVGDITVNGVLITSNNYSQYFAANATVLFM